MKETILSRISGWIDENSAILADANNAIWEFAETAFNEKCSSAYLKQVLEQYGFRILPGAAGVPTSFVAEWGCGKPVIGLISEYDALHGAPSRSRRCSRSRLRSLHVGRCRAGCGTVAQNRNGTGWASRYAPLLRLPGGGNCGRKGPDVPRPSF